MHVFILPTQRFLSCQICHGVMFAQREIKMTTTGMTFLDLDWLNRSADGVICVRCGFVHTFFGGAHQWVRPEDVRPGDLPVDPFAGSAAPSPLGAPGAAAPAAGPTSGPTPEA